MNTLTIPAKSRACFELMRFHRPIGIYLLLWPTLWGLWVAKQGQVPWHTLLVFILGTIVMRSFGCVINDIADQRFDPHVARTSSRPLACGALHTHDALCVASILATLAVALLFALPKACLPLAAVAMLLAISYPFCKRFTHLPQVVLGLSFAFGIPMAFAALKQPLDLRCWGLYAVAVLWPIAYDTVYAMMDVADDEKIGVHSIVVWLGDQAQRLVLATQGLVLTAWTCYFVIFPAGLMPFIGSLVGLWFWFDLKRRLNTATIDAYAKAFQCQHWLGCALWLTLLAAYGLR